MTTGPSSRPERSAAPGLSEAATTREKRLKRWRRAWKVELIEAKDPGWNVI